MLIEKGITMYAALKDEKVVGIFSEPEKAQAIEPDSVQTVELLHMEGSPSLEGSVCMAKGTCSTLNFEDGKFSTETCSTGQVWGTNPQSAIAGLFGFNFTRRNVSFTDFFIFEADVDYTDEPPANLSDAGVFSSLFHSLSDIDSFTAENAASNYIDAYWEKLASDNAYAERYECPQYKLVSSYEINRRAKNMLKARPRRTVCGFALSRTEQHLLRRLYHAFTVQEIKTLAVVLKIDADEEISRQIADGTISDEYADALLQRFKKQTSMV